MNEDDLIGLSEVFESIENTAEDLTTYINKSGLPFIDKWDPAPYDPNLPPLEQDMIVSFGVGIAVAPIRYALTKYAEPHDMNDIVNRFDIRAKKAYNSEEMRKQTCRYINYFLKYYDIDKEYIAILAYIKHRIDYHAYSVDELRYEILRYMLSPTMLVKINKLVDDNYCIPVTTDRSKTVVNLQYTEQHARLLNAAGVIINLCIPITTHYLSVHRASIPNTDKFLSSIHEPIINGFSVNMLSKLYETAINAVSKDIDMKNFGLWVNHRQDIRGYDATILALVCVHNIIVNIMPKYTFKGNVVKLNYSTIQHSLGYKINNIKYEYDYISITSIAPNSSNNNDDVLSEFDKFEANIAKQDEALYFQNKVNCITSTDTIRKLYGPFDKAEIEFYKQRLGPESLHNQFQKLLIFNLCAKYYGDQNSMNMLNIDQYIELMLASKKMLLDCNMTVLPYIISGKTVRKVGRKSINKKEKERMMLSPNYENVIRKYNNPKIYEAILNNIATAIASEFKIIDFHNPEIDDRIIEIDPVIIIEEMLLYVLQI